jgi:S-formylglutathione hydrolase
VYVPVHTADEKLPVLYYLSGLTCTEDNFTSKAAAYAEAAKQGCIIVAPDTSPRGEGVADDDGYDLGQGAGFYVDATEQPWAEHFQMYRYISEELPALIAEHFPIDSTKQGIFGHSMGGHGALTIYLKNPDTFKSVSAFAPICAPIDCPWGKKALSAYLGDDQSKWLQYDATKLMLSLGDASHRPEILIDQGLDDNFLAEQLHPEMFVKACAKSGQKVTLRKHPGYDHGYFFIQTFINDHIQHHMSILCHDIS